MQLHRLLSLNCMVVWMLLRLYQRRKSSNHSRCGLSCTRGVTVMWLSSNHSRCGMSCARGVTVIESFSVSSVVRSWRDCSSFTRLTMHHCLYSTVYFHFVDATEQLQIAACRQFLLNHILIKFQLHHRVSLVCQQHFTPKSWSSSLLNIEPKTDSVSIYDGSRSLLYVPLLSGVIKNEIWYDYCTIAYITQFHRCSCDQITAGSKRFSIWTYFLPTFLRK